MEAVCYCKPCSFSSALFSSSSRTLLLPVASPACPPACPALLAIRASKGKRRFGPGAPQQRNTPPAFPKLEDDGNPKFVIFARDKLVPLWFPLNIVSGGSLAKIVVSAMGNDWGKKMAQGTLTRDLGNAIYKDEKSIRMTAIRIHPVLKSATDLEYGYKIVDMDNQRAAFLPSNVTKIPPREELKTVADKVKGFFGEGLSGIKDSFGSFKFGGEEDSSTSKKDSNTS